MVLKNRTGGGVGTTRDVHGYLHLKEKNRSSIGMNGLVDCDTLVQLTHNVSANGLWRLLHEQEWTDEEVRLIVGQAVGLGRDVANMLIESLRGRPVLQAELFSQL